MFSEKLFKAALALFGLLCIAATPFTHPNLTNNYGMILRDTIIIDSCIDESFSKPFIHIVNSDGTCNCLPGLSEEQMGSAPRILMPQHANLFSKQYISKNKWGLDKIKARSAPYFNTINKVFENHKLPVELKYLAVIESRLNNNIVSTMGAVGLWQFMPASARKFGLRTSGTDERRNTYKSTVAAARYILYLNKIFDDWLLTVAAYNSGPAPILSAIKRSGSRDYWKLESFLPLETRKHVKKFIATHYYFEGHGSLVTMTKQETRAHFKATENFMKEMEEIKKDSTVVNPVISANLPTIEIRNKE